MRVFPHLKLPIRFGLSAFDRARSVMVSWRCHGAYDGNNLRGFRERHGSVPVLLCIPPMSDREGALIHPGVQILQSILRAGGIGCEIINYGLPVRNPRQPFEHLHRMVEELDLKVVGVSLYSQAIRSTMVGLKRLKEAFPDLTIVVGGPHPTEAYLSLVGVRFIDYVVRGEAEESFPRLVKRILGKGNEEGSEAIPGVYHYDRENREILGVPPQFVDLAPFDRDRLLRYQLSDDEIRQYRLYGGSHGLVGPRYWPVALVRGCPYACTYCAAYQMSGKTLRFREVSDVVDDMQEYLEKYGQRHFSFVDDSFTEHYDFVTEFCREIQKRRLKVFWTTDNGIRYESLGSGKRLGQFLRREHQDTESLLAEMIRSGWSGTSVGIESGSLRVRRDLVRKGGASIDNVGIEKNLKTLKDVAKAEGVYFYINAYLMIGFPSFFLRNGQEIPGETDEERLETYRFALTLKKAGVVDFIHPSVVIPLPATEMWDHLTIEEKMDVLTSRLSEDDPERPSIEKIMARVREQYPGARYREDSEMAFWKGVYDLSDEAQIGIHSAYDYFNADSSYKILLRRPEGEVLWSLRQRMLEDFYSGVKMEIKLLQHVLQMTSSLWEVVGYLACLSRIYLPDTKERGVVPSPSREA